MSGIKNKTAFQMAQLGCIEAEPFVHNWLNYNKYLVRANGSINNKTIEQEFNYDELQSELVVFREDLANYQNTLRTRYRNLLKRSAGRPKKVEGKQKGAQGLSEQKQKEIKLAASAGIPSLTSIREALKIVLTRCMKDEIKKLAASMACPAPCNGTKSKTNDDKPAPVDESTSETRRFLAAVTSREPADVDLVDLEVLRHWLWQVKRKLNQLPIRWELMLNIYGPQGTGKTTCVRRLSAAFDDVYGEMSLKQLLDDRAQALLSGLYINLFEELEGSLRTDVDSLKKLMSGRKLSWRVLGSHRGGFGQQNCTFIATSNKRIGEAFYDPSGMRRFYEIDCPRNVVPARLAAVDFGRLWQEVDETNNHGYLDAVKGEVEARQERMRQLTPLENFLAAYEVKEGLRALGTHPNTKDLRRSSGRDLYAKYKLFCEDTGFKPVNGQTFRRQLQEHLAHEIHKGDVYFTLASATVAQMRVEAHNVILRLA